MADRPYTVLSVGMSIDGYIDSAGEDRLLLSNAADLDRVDEVRAWSDAIMVGANTVRNDDPRLLVRGADRRRGRLAEGRTPSPAKVTVTVYLAYTSRVREASTFGRLGRAHCYAPGLDGRAR